MEEAAIHNTTSGEYEAIVTAGDISERRKTGDDDMPSFLTRHRSTDDAGAPQESSLLKRFNKEKQVGETGKEPKTETNKETGPETDEEAGNDKEKSKETNGASKRAMEGSLEKHRLPGLTLKNNEAKQNVRGNHNGNRQTDAAPPAPDSNTKDDKSEGNVRTETL
eukprot:GHVU01172593.1.p1 GENE.GHVU01172593.1~~GHVU01172593.1.p1  ORF type:complete len:165 (+),score=34.07 GHVU01172593.1:550-1044(+)